MMINDCYDNVKKDYAKLVPNLKFFQKYIETYVESCKIQNLIVSL